jgi:hypothetical protein
LNRVFLTKEIPVEQVRDRSILVAPHQLELVHRVRTDQGGAKQRNQSAKEAA